MQDIVGWAWSGKVAEFEQGQIDVANINDRQTEGSYCCIQLDGTASPFCVHLDVNASYAQGS